VFKDEAAVHYAPSRNLGADTHAVLRELGGLDAARIATLEQRGAFGQTDAPHK
jgi:crotonobetainyl-CoA:carnitine CoA-transferase CaiB-like acyl-CoA transferase